MNHVPREKHKEKVKAVIIGDGASGKTCMAVVYQGLPFPDDYVPTVLENFTSNANIGDTKVELNLWDTAGQEEFDQIRKIAYHNADVVLLTFSLNNPDSYDNIKEKWIPDAKKEMPQAKLVLVGTMKDLQAHPTEERLKQQRRRETRATAYLECSAINNDGVKEVFDQVMMAGLQKIDEVKNNKANENKKKCFIF